MVKNTMIQDLVELQKRGIEPFMTIEGWTEFFRLLQEEELEDTEKAG